MTDNTQLTPACGYDTERMIFSEPIIGTIPDSKPAISFKRITISTRNEDGSIGELIIPTERIFSFGVSENISQDTGKINGYVMPLCLFNRDGATKEEKEWVKTFENIVEKCKDHLIDNKDEIEQYDLERRDLKKLNCLYYKKDKGKVVEGTGPTLYAKLITSKKQENKIVTMFFDNTDKQIQGIDLLGKYCYAKAAIKIESIFIGNKISLQLKLYECEVELMQSGMKRLLPRPNSVNRVLTKVSSNKPPLPDGGDDDEVGSLDGDFNDMVVEDSKQKKPIKKIIKKVIKKKQPDN